MVFLRTIDLIGVGKDAGFSMFLWLNVPPGLMYVLYHPVLELFMHGNSPGKRSAGVRIVDEHGAPPTVTAILIRNVFRLIDSLPIAYTVGLITVLLSRRQVRFGDMVAGTVMVRAGEKVSERLATMERIQAAPIDAKTAELVMELLDRRSGMDRKRWISLGETLLMREGIELEKKTHKTVRAALEALLISQ